MIIVNNVDEKCTRRQHIAYYVKQTYERGYSWLILEELELVDYLTIEKTHHVRQYETSEIKRIQYIQGVMGEVDGLLNLYLAEKAVAQIVKLKQEK